MYSQWIDETRYDGGGKIRTRSRTTSSESIKIRNARERDRVKTLNTAYEDLRDRLPQTKSLRGKKMSKYDTLQSAIQYIQSMKSMLTEDGNFEMVYPLTTSSSESGFSSTDSSASHIYSTKDLSEADSLVKTEQDIHQGHAMYMTNPVAMSLAAKDFAGQHSLYVTPSSPPRCDQYPHHDSPYPTSEDYDSVSLEYDPSNLRNHFPIHVAADVKTEEASYDSHETVSFNTYE